MFKKRLAVLLTAVMLVTSSLPSALAGTFAGNRGAKLTQEMLANTDRSREQRGDLSTSQPEKQPVRFRQDKPIPNAINVEVSSSLLSMTDPRVIDVAVDFGYTPQLENLQWTFGGQAFEEWKKWSALAGTYSGEPFITFAETPTVEGTTVKAKIKFDLVYTLAKQDSSGHYIEVPTADLSSRSVRTLYPDLIGLYNFTIEDVTSNKIASTQLKLNVYDSYRTYDQLKPAIDEIFSQANTGRYLEYKSLGKTAENRDIHFVILAKDKASVDNYLNNFLPEMLEHPESLQDQLQTGTLTDYKVPIWFNNIHADEAPGPDAILDLLKTLATEDRLQYATEENQVGSETTINVDEALNDVIFLFNFTENPDGRYYNTRDNSKGFDLNRDNAYQTQLETQAVTGEIAKWTPISFLDFHGFVKDFLIEPCTPPHDPNYEYDLLIDNMLAEADAMGQAGIANTKYDHYIIPFRDYGVGWDDAVPSYTATYAMEHGALGHTIEIPELNEDSHDALMAAGLASTKFVIDNKAQLFNNQLEYFRRGVANEDNPAVDQWLVDADNFSIGRQRVDGQNFFPEYYVLPVAEKLQKNPLEAYKMVQYLLRNGVEVTKLTKNIRVDDTIYPAGSFVVPMHQAKRGYANTVLYDGADVSDFQEMYAEIVLNFQDLRGFDRYIVRQQGVFDKQMMPLTQVQIPKSDIKGHAEQYIIRNSNNDAIKAVNSLLAQAKPVQLVLAGGQDFSQGDYLVNRTDLETIQGEFFLDVVAANQSNIPTKPLKAVTIGTATSEQTISILKELGFKVVEDPAQGDVILDEAGNDYVPGKPYIGMGGYALMNIADNNFFENFEFGNLDPYMWGLYYEGLLKSELNQTSLITSSYDAEELLYSASGSWISNVPTGATILATVSTQDDYFKCGWWPGHEAVQGQVLAYTQQVAGADVTLFAADLTNKAHPQNTYRLLTNAIFNSVIGE